MPRPDPRAIRVSTFLARHLRHRPQDIGLRLQPGGWVEVDELLEAAARAGFAFSRAELDAAVAEPTKRRYGYDAGGRRVRAVQGHSVPVDLGYAPSAPPDVLYHGTHPRAVGAILREGLRPMRRRQVHLSADRRTAAAVGARRGRPVVLGVDAAGMHRDGRALYRAPNGVWLVDEVPARYLGRA